jgi:ATP-binding cassette, subfamily B, multidrug efflux pump
MNAQQSKSNQSRQQFGSRGGQGGHGPGGMLGQPVEKAKDFKGTLKRLLRYLRPYTFKMIVVFLLTILGNVFSIISPKIMGNATSILFNGEVDILKKVPGAHINFNALLQILISLLVLYLFSALFTYLQQVLMSRVSQGTVYDLRKSVYDKLTRLPLKYYDSQSHGDILSRVTNDIDNVSNTLQQSLTQLLSAIVTLVGIVIMMLTINVWLALITMVVLPFAFGVTSFVASRSQKFFAAQQKTLGQLNGHVEEMYTGHKIVKAFGYEGKAIQSFKTINRDLYDAGWKAQFISGILMPMLSVVNNIGYILVCVVGGIFVIRKSMTIGDVQAFIQYSRQFSQPILQTANIANIIQSTIASAERVFEMLDQPEQIPDPQDARHIASPKGELSFDHVNFSYSKDVELIEDMNFRVQPGQMIAIVGPTGAGKTTLVNLMMRFYEIDQGKINVDQTNISEMDRGDLRRLFGMVLQDTWLFKGTIRDNIAYGCEDVSEEQIIKAAKAAHADHFIRTLPDGYNTILNEEASNISQGQKQLLTIARAILAEPTILILDEATSSVDTRTEILIQKAMTAMMKDRTSFVIAHRLSTIRDADLILVMNNGRVIETGTHKQLLEQDGFYADLYNSQFTSKSTLNGNGNGNGNIHDHVRLDQQALSI